MALANGRHLAHGIELEGLDISVKPGKALPHLWVLEHWFSIQGTAAAQFNESLQALLENNDNAQRETPALVHQRGKGYHPALIQFADQVLHRHFDVFKEQLGKFGLTRHLDERPAAPSRRL